MTESPAQYAQHHHPDLSIDQQLALRTAATRLRTSSTASSASRPSNGSCTPPTTSSPAAPPSPTSCRCWPNASPANACNALAKVEGKITDGKPDRAVPVHPQRRPLPDGARLLHPPRRRPRRRLVRRLRTRQRDQPRRHRSHGRSRHRHHRRVPQALDRRDRPRRRRRHHHGLRRRLPDLPRQALRGLGTRRPRRPRPSTPSGPSATRSKNGSAACSPNSTSPPRPKHS